MKSQRGQKPERKTEDKKMEKIVKWLEGCGFNKSEATKEAEAMIKYHTTGYDAVSREYAIELILADID